MSSETKGLAKLESATRMLAEIKTVDDAKKIINLAEAARVYAREVELGLEAQNHAAEIKLRAQRRAGEILREMTDKGERQQRGGNRGNQYVAKSQDVTLPQLADVGISKIDSSRWQQIAEVPKKEFEKVIERVKSEGKELTTSTMLETAKEIRKEQKKQEVIAQAKTIEPNANIIIGDFREVGNQVADNSVDLIFTDPPYDESAIPLYSDLALFAKRVLKPGGSLICYAGHYAIPHILPLMIPHMRYWWLIACKHNGNAARLPGKWVFVEWKPMLWFVKEKLATSEYVADLIQSQPCAKEHHEWEQGLTEAKYYIEHLTQPNGLICDPFCGGGTTCIAALELGRQYVAIEKENDTALIAQARIHDYSSELPTTLTTRT